MFLWNWAYIFLKTLQLNVLTIQGVYRKPLTAGALLCMGFLFIRQQNHKPQGGNAVWCQLLKLSLATGSVLVAVYWIIFFLSHWDVFYFLTERTFVLSWFRYHVEQNGLMDSFFFFYSVNVLTPKEDIFNVNATCKCKIMCISCVVWIVYMWL